MLMQKAWPKMLQIDIKFFLGGEFFMIAKYSLPEMSKVWSEENRYQKMLDVEVAAVEAMAELGTVPKEAYQQIKEKVFTCSCLLYCRISYYDCRAGFDRACRKSTFH